MIILTFNKSPTGLRVGVYVVLILDKTFYNYFCYEGEMRCMGFQRKIRFQVIGSPASFFDCSRDLNPRLYKDD